MQGLLNKALQGFLTEAYGPQVWDTVRRGADIPFQDFEAMLHYDAATTRAVVQSAAHVLEKPKPSILEDAGTWIVANPDQERMRRLLRFGGGSFREFLYSLEDLPGRAKMALPTLDVPEFELTQTARSMFDLAISWDAPDLVPMLLGALRAMADDYGALVLMEVRDEKDSLAMIEIELLDDSFAQGRSFELGATGP